MTWCGRLVDEFLAEYEAFQRRSRTHCCSGAKLLELYGPTLGRPHVDTLKAPDTSI